MVLSPFLAHRAYVILKPEFSFPLSYYLIPFTGVVGMIILVMCVVLVSGHLHRLTWSY